MSNKRKGKREVERNSKRSDKRNGLFFFALLLTLGFAFRGTVARLLPNDTPDDSKVYAQIARNVLEQHAYSLEAEPPYSPTLIRVPGYPLFLAAVYAVFGHGDNTAVRIVQALIDTASCVLIAVVAYFWEPDERQKRRSSIAAFALAVVCPFTTIYVATVLTETLAVFFAVAVCLMATLALTAKTQKSAVWLWAATGLVAGVSVMVRPDSGLFALAIGITLVVTTLARSNNVKLGSKRDEVLYRSARASYLGVVFSLAFCLALAPWAIRNFRVFHFFQPLAPAHAEMPGEFVPRGYLTWVRTWIDDGRYVGPAIWAMETSPIKLADIPDSAFDSAEEKQRVAALLEKYNHPNEAPELFVEPTPEGQPTASPDESDETATETESPSNESPTPDEAEETPEDDEKDEANPADETNSPDEAEENTPADQTVEMTPEIDAGFAQIAQERNAQHPFRYYVLLPLKRAHSLWFDTHSQYYPFEGDLLPLSDLDYDIHQQYWLPLFAALTFVYSLLGIAGGWFLWQTGKFIARQWLLLVTLMIFLRLGFFATLENPEPRYVVEIFPFLSILGGIAVARMIRILKNRTT